MTAHLRGAPPKEDHRDMRRRCALPLLATVVVAAAAGCGGGGGGGSSTPTRAQAPATTSGTTTTGAAAGAAVAQGKQVFTGEGGCGSCHTLADAGTSGSVGPNLDQVLPGKGAAFIRQSIVSPNAVIAKGYPAGVMPQDFAQRLGTAKVAALVAYLSSVAGK